jgi:hypothetical protein
MNNFLRLKNLGTSSVRRYTKEQITYETHSGWPRTTPTEYVQKVYVLKEEERKKVVRQITVQLGTMT